MPKTNKAVAKRLKLTKKGKLIGRKPGGNHFNAKERRVKQLGRKKGVEFTMKNKDKSRLLPFA
jgi:ribosomal protein L35